VIVAVLDGLRPDAIDRFGLRHWATLARQSAWTPRATSVAPSVTAVALTSLFTGVAPSVHGIESETFALPRQPQRLVPVTRVLADAGIASHTFIRRLPFVYRGLARRFSRLAGVDGAVFAGDTAAEILGAAHDVLADRRPGFVFLHWPDADRAGHAHGWMSPDYGAAARRLDFALGALALLTDVTRDPGTLLIACADHGGGGADPKHHNSAHPDDRTIPVLLAGGAVTAGRLPDGVHWLDIPATVLWALGAPVPATYTGRPIAAAFAGVSAAA
jgi:predicted AlkP superfamily pyrophosphatase or phosphodiesterase